MKKPIVVVGMMGAGKSAVGAALAARLGVPFIDSDQEIEKAAAMTIAEIFERDGEHFFRAREREVIRRLLASGPMVLATGGGAFLSAETRETIAETGVAVWLRADLDLLWERVRHKTTRPLLRTADPRGTLATLYAARVGHYAKADIVVDARPEYSIAEMTEAVLAALIGQGAVVEESR